MAFLMIKADDMVGRKVELDQTDTTIGRAGGNNVALDDPAMSSFHCVIHRSGQTFTVKDLQSTNGITVNNKKVMETVLHPKDVIRVGSIELVFDGHGVETDPRTAFSSDVSEFGNEDSPFTTRKMRTGPWVVIFGILAAIIVTSMLWFIFRLFSS